MAREWTEAAIREELARLDAMTGLHGAALPISFGRGRCVLVDFPDAGRRRLGLGWVDKNCRRCT